MYVEKPSEGSFTPVQPGVYKAVCSRFVDLGTRHNEMYNKDQHRVMITWQVPSERVEIEGADLPIQHNEFYTWSMHPDSNLRKMLESWRGRAFTEADLAGPPHGFNTKNLIGVGCFLQIMHNDKGKAVASAIMQLPKAEWPEIEGDPLYFQMQQAPFDLDAFERLTDGLKKTIEDTPEWLRVKANGASQRPRDDALPNDDIPF